ncbi:hypothetical protein [Streptomyces sp. NPDC048481]|uniref:hypothetical protein n=1 Tax=Streptomyces sp. NPDC048481 TaxID=3365557 RepID=UPI003720B3F4
MAVQAVKAALAAWSAWAVAGWWLKAPVAFVAPWVAIVLVESTVYRSIARLPVHRAGEDRAASRPDPTLARRYADFLRQTAHALRLYSQSRFSHQNDQELRQAVQELHRTLEALRDHLSHARPDDPDEVATYGTLLTQAHRLAGRLVT